MDVENYEDYIYLLELGLREVGAENIVLNARKIIDSGVDINRVSNIEEMLKR